jgi:outer membrane protein assembly factor BamB
MKQKLLTIGAACALVAAAGLVGARAATAPDYANTKDYNARAAKPSAGDWTMWGGTPHRNMVSAEKNPPTDWDVGDKDDPADNKNVRWEQLVGSKAYGNPVIANGKVFVGTNNEGKRDPKYTVPNPSSKDGTDAIDGGVLMCFDEKSGKFLWQKYYAKLPSGRVNDWPGEGLCSTVYAENNGRIYYCTNRCEVVCLDVSASAPEEVWKLDMMSTLGVFPHNMTTAAPVAYGDYLYVITANGVDDTHKNVVAPQAPAIVCINKQTGKVVWTDNAPGDNVLHGQWSSVSVAEVNGRAIVIAPLGDGWIYAYDAKDGKPVWRFDTNPKESIYPQTRNEIIATPVIVGNRMYIANGQDPEHGTGKAHLWCVRIDKEGDISPEISNAPKPKVGQDDELVAPSGEVPSRKGKPNPNSGVVWHFYTQDDNGDGKFRAGEQMHRTISTVAVSDGLVYCPDFSGFLHCLDAETGKQVWWEDLESDVWGSPLVCDGKVYVGDGDGDIAIFKAGREKELIATHNMGAAVYGSPVMANGAMYILSLDKLFCIEEKK